MVDEGASFRKSQTEIEKKTRVLPGELSNGPELVARMCVGGCQRGRGWQKKGRGGMFLPPSTVDRDFSLAANLVSSRWRQIGNKNEKRGDHKQVTR